jgi:methyl-accepting chemotaxis protein
MSCQGDETGVLAKAFGKITHSLRLMKKDVDMLIGGALEGKLDTRADISAHQGAYREIIDGVNKSLDVITGPLNMAAVCIDRISRGDVPKKISYDYNGDFNILKNNPNTCIDTAADYIDKLSRGSIPDKITEDYNGDFNIIKNNLNTCIDAIDGLVTDTNMMSQAALEENLSARADSQRHQGDFRCIIEGFNNTLDEFIEPLKESAQVLDEMAQGNLKITVQGDYKGELARIKYVLNTTINAMSGYISKISAVLSEISNGNLNVSIHSDYKGDFVQIKDSINNIIVSLNDTIREIRYASDEVAAGSSQVSGGSQLFSQGATEQSSAIEQLNVSISKIAAQTRQNPLNAGKANEITDEVRNDAIGGNEQMKQLLAAMEEINQSSANIKKIIKVIDDIAFQTNILVLNAAMEAARAGQYGKGFAVVAEEVCNLAARSAGAADETASLIENSIKKSELGMKIADGTAEALNKIVNGIERAAEMMAMINGASNEQATGAAQISRGIKQISQVVQTNSTTAEQSATSSEELSGQSKLLKEKIGRFRLRGGIAQH